MAANGRRHGARPCRPALINLSTDQRVKQLAGPAQIVALIKENAVATINQLVELIERGWPPHMIRQKLEIKPYRLAQMLSSPTVQHMVANHQRLTRLTSQYKACRHAMSAVGVLREVLQSTNVSGETARKAAGQMLRVAGCSGWQASAGEKLRQGPDPLEGYIRPPRRSRRKRGAVVCAAQRSNHVVSTFNSAERPSLVKNAPPVGQKGLAAGRFVTLDQPRH